ncbi:MAG: urease accessory protein UreE [Pseudomarimonas sp.]
MTLLLLQATHAPSQSSALPEPLYLTFDQRKRSRLRMSLADGRELAWALSAGQTLHPGDRLSAASGEGFEVRARTEPLLRITASSPQAMARAAYHLGNRHVTVEVGTAWLAIEPDAVLQDMLLQLGVAVTAVEAAFVPETGAYGGGHKHGHDETFAADYELSQQLFAMRHPQHGASTETAEEASAVEQSDGHHSHQDLHASGADHSHSHPHPVHGSPMLTAFVPFCAPQVPVIADHHASRTATLKRQLADDHLD